MRGKWARLVHLNLTYARFINRRLDISSFYPLFFLLSEMSRCKGSMFPSGKAKLRSRRQLVR